MAAAAGPTAGKKEKLKLTACTVDDSAGKVVAGGPTFEVMINPSQYRHDRGISYSDQKPLGSVASPKAFSSFNDEEVSFDEIVIDGTGAVRVENSREMYPDVETQMKSLTDIIYKYSGEKHEPPWVRLLWGSLIFFGRLKSMSVTYTLFTPGGHPLRAKVRLSFVGAMSPEQESLVTKRSSPDLSHQVMVIEGDTLPLLCHRIYGDSLYYSKVAETNGLTNFRRLTPGTRLWFPPLA